MAAPESARWTLKRGDPLEVFATMSPSRAPGEQFQVRLLYREYPGLPSLRFRDPATGRLDNARAWPQCPGFRPQSLDTCVSWTAEGHALHPEWGNAPATRLNRTGNVLFRSLCILQDTLDFGFTGRYGG
ncbi:MAG: hypothetical protein HY313_00355 [Acidobacteria bacterium]|nr:hypothetical protein [Acidobacteriota bacterium]